MACSRLRCVAAMMRTLQRYCSALPTRSKTLSCSTRSSLTCMGRLMSPISSRNSVPPSASSNRPLRVATAPVNAPFSWPNSSLSSRSAGMAPQFTAMKGRLRRGLEWWIALATTSLPVPDSPRISTLDSCPATWAMRDWICCIDCDCPVGPLCAAMPAMTSCSAVAMRPIHARRSGVHGFSQGAERQKSDALRQSTEDACDPRLTWRTARLPDAGNMPPVPPERQLLDQVGRRLPRWRESDAHLPFGCDLRHVCNQRQRLRQAFAQVDIQESLFPVAGWCSALPHGAQRIESYRRRRRARLLCGQQLAHEFQHQVHLHFEPQQVGGMHGFLLGLLHRPLLLDRGADMQRAHIPLGQHGHGRQVR